MTNQYCFSGRLHHLFIPRLLVLIPFIGLAACDGNTAKVTDTTNNPVVATQDVANTSVTSGICVDTAPIGDGWGWNGTDSCRITSEDNTTVLTQETSGSTVANTSSEVLDNEVVSTELTVTADNIAPSISQQQTTPANTEQDYTLGVGSITDLILVTGQSNALGADTGFSPSLDAPNERVFAYTDQGWQVANLNQTWDLGRYPRNSINEIPSNNFGLHFGKRMAERRSDRVVGIVLVTAPGESISHWDGNGEFFAQIRDKVSRAISDLPYKSRVDAVLWHQGESDGEDRNEYGDALFELITDFRSEPWFEFGFPFICGETASLPVNRQLQRLNSDNDPWTACIEAEGLATVGDDAHFNAESLRTIGQRYADQYIEMFLAD